MGATIRLEAGDEFKLGGYEALPSGTPRGGVVVLQEIFGVNPHIKAVCDRLAGEGYHAVAPALFDRYEKDYQSGYSPREVDRSRELMASLDWDKLLVDAEAARAHLARSHQKVAAVGFCLGGSIAYRMAIAPKRIAAAVCFYGGMIVKHADQAPRCAVQMHFGETDHSIPMSDVREIQVKRPECEVHVYPAGHGFFNDARTSFEPVSAALSWQRTRDLLATSTAD